MNESEIYIHEHQAIFAPALQGYIMQPRWVQAVKSNNLNGGV